MKTLALVNGDLVVASSGHATISGASKVRQDLSLALGEYWGTDRFHSDQWGSTVVDYIGLPITDDLQFQVRAEVSRVISNYIAIQDAEVYADLADGTRSRYDTADVVRSVDAIVTRLDYNTVQLKVTLSTQADQSVTVTRTVTP